MKPQEPNSLTRPSAAYGPRAWRCGLWAARWLPPGLSKRLALAAAWLYRTLRPGRQRVLEANLLPVLDGDRTAARNSARRVLLNFTLKVLDLLRHESGASAEIPVCAWRGYEILKAALDRKKGVLLVTPHLGNWEFGGYLLAQREVPLLVLTQAEPGQGFTELRQQARERWGIETLVVGQDSFAFVEIIKRLQDGATVALLLDRPPARSAVEVRLFGHPFRASVAVAELARASGCAIIPVYVVKEPQGYSAHVLPEIVYDRRAVGKVEGRIALTGEIMRSFEPSIRQYADQWYHFVPIWPDSKGENVAPK